MTSVILWLRVSTNARYSCRSSSFSWAKSKLFNLRPRWEFWDTEWHSFLFLYFQHSMPLIPPYQTFYS